MPLPTEVFFSHSHDDAASALVVIDEMRRHGVPTWYAPHAVLGARQWHDEIGAALRRCDWFVVLLTPRSVAARWVKHELVYALSNARYENRILPLLREDCDWESLSWTLGGMQRIDLRTIDEPSLGGLLRTWGVGYRPLAP